MYINDQQGFHGMFANLDYSTTSGTPALSHGKGSLWASLDRNHLIILGTMANKKVWFWHAYCGVPRSNNHLNMLN